MRADDEASAFSVPAFLEIKRAANSLKLETGLLSDRSIPAVFSWILEILAADVFCRMDEARHEAPFVNWFRPAPT